MPFDWALHYRTTERVQRAFAAISSEAIRSRFGAVLRERDSVENRVLELEGNLILKLYRPERWSHAAIDEELCFLRDLEEAGVPVANAIESGVFDGVFYTLYPKIKGRELPDPVPDEMLAPLGRLAAHIHEVGARRDAPLRPVIEPRDYGLGNMRVFLPYVPAALRERYERLIEGVVLRGELLFRDVPMHRVHADFYGGNCIQTTAGFVSIDFDDMMIGPAIQDVWLIARTKDASETRRRIPLVASGYREVRAFEDAWIDLFPTLDAIRFMWIGAWIMTRSFDPKFRSTYPSFFETPGIFETQLERLERLTLGAVPTR